MFPYPSGRIHMGHVRNYTLGDVVARLKRAQGYNVLHPMGWDAFGLPAEGAAISAACIPKAWTYANIAEMREQIKAMGLSLDWSREIATCDPDYYGHEQAMFIELWKRGLVYRKESWVNWDPVDQTVLANEQVIDGRGWRSGAPVERRKLAQWFFKITAYADDLLGAPGPARRLAGEGPADAAQLDRPVDGARGSASPSRAATSRSRCSPPGPTRCSAQLHGDRTRSSAEQRAARPAIRGSPPSSPNACAAGPALPSWRRGEARLRHRPALPPSVRRRVELPVYVANFVLMDYGTGAIFGCPAHDQRDLDFARKYGRPVLPVVLPPGADPASFAIGDEAYTGDGQLFNSGFLDGLEVERGEVARDRRARAARASGEGETTYRLRDWGISRQRYWGCPVPMIRLRTAAARAGAGGHAAGRAARRCRLLPAGQPAGPPPDLEARRAARIGRHGASARPTRSTPSSRAHGTSPGSARPICRRRRSAREEADYWLPVDQYIGGVEHAVLHLLYARFFTRAMRDMRPARHRRAVHRAVHPGHDQSSHLQGRARAAGSSPPRSRRTRRGRGCRSTTGGRCTPAGSRR